MSEVAEPQTRPIAKPDDLAAKHAFAHVEKWMAMIREINSERPVQTRTPRLSDLPGFSTE